LAAAHAQHVAQHQAPYEGQHTPDTSSASSEHAGHAQHHGMQPRHDMSNILAEPLGSGTGWLTGGAQPHEHAVHLNAGGWMLMTHGEAVLRYNTANFNNKRRWSTSLPRSGGQSNYP